MSMRIQEVHPSLVHFPIALLPTSLGADLLGRLTRNKALSSFGRWGMGMTAGSALLSSLAGLVAQEASQVEGRAHDLLVTHRNLNIGLVGLTTVLALRRSSTDRPGMGYFTAGLVGLGTMLYSAYLGGKMVYEHGVGVRPAGGLREAQAPEIERDTIGQAGHAAVDHVIHGAGHAAEHIAEGEIAPTLTRSRKPPQGGSEG